MNILCIYFLNSLLERINKWLALFESSELLFTFSIYGIDLHCFVIVMLIVWCFFVWKWTGVHWLGDIAQLLSEVEWSGSSGSALCEHSQLTLMTWLPQALLSEIHPSMAALGLGQQLLLFNNFIFDSFTCYSISFIYGPVCVEQGTYIFFWWFQRLLEFTLSK